MKHITMADKSLLVGDEAADALVSYAALVAQRGSGDSIQLNAVGTDGEEVVASFLLNSGTVLMTESTNSTLPEPDNAAATAYMQQQLRAFATSDADAVSADYPYGNEQDV